jgi:hypothetical protein
MRSVIYNALRRIMRVFFITIIAIVLVVSACFSGACVSQKPDIPGPALNSTSSSITPGPAPVVESQLSPNSFEVAKGHLGEYLDTDPETNPDHVIMYKKSPETISVLFIQGVSVDISGNARMWVFGVRTSNGTQLRTYDPSGWTYIPLDDPSSSVEINLDHIISPGALFEKNREAVFGPSPMDTERREIELKNGNYSVSRIGTPGIKRFDATTGAPV